MYSKSVCRSVRVRGSCSLWVPLVRDCLSDRGFRNIAVDGCRLTADFDRGSVAVTLSQSAVCGETDVRVVSTAGLSALDHNALVWVCRSFHLIRKEKSGKTNKLYASPGGGS